MLDFIRQRSQGWLSWGIVILIIIPFALWGVQEYVGGGGEVNVATVNDESIAKQQLEMAYYRQRQRLQEMFGESFNPDMFPEERMKQQLLEDLIKQEVIRQAALSRKMGIGDHHLAQNILSIPSFQVDGMFSQDAYERILLAQGMQPGYFEYQVRRDMLNQQYTDAISQSAFVTDAEVAAYYSLSKQQRNVGWMIIAAESFTDQVEVSDAEVEKRYNDNPALFQQPEQMRVAYLDLSVAKLAEGIEIPEADIEARYESQKSNFVAPEQRSARHILIKVAQDADEESAAAALERIKALRERVLAGEPLADLAKEFSEDAGSKGLGGELGFFTATQMVKPFSDAAFAMQPGELSEPVRSQYGYHLIELGEIKASAPKPFAEVREQILTEMRNEIAREHFFEQAEQLTNLTYEHPDNLQAAAEILGIEVQQSEPFPRSGGDGLFANPKVTSAAFSDEVMLRGNNSEVIEVSDSQLVVVRMVEHLPEQLRPLADVRDEIVNAIKREKSQELALAAATQITDALQQGKSANELAAEHGVEWNEETALLRDAQTPARDLVSAIFELPHPQADKPLIERVAISGGDQAIVSLVSVTPGDSAEGDKAELDALKQTLENGSATAASNGVVEVLKASAKIRRIEQ